MTPPGFSFYVGSDRSVPGVITCSRVSEDDLKVMSWLDLRALGVMKLLAP